MEQMNLSNLWNNTKQSNIHVTGTPEREGEVCVCAHTHTLGKGWPRIFKI